MLILDHERSNSFTWRNCQCLDARLVTREPMQDLARGHVPDLITFKKYFQLFLELLFSSILFKRNHSVLLKKWYRIKYQSPILIPTPN